MALWRETFRNKLCNFLLKISNSVFLGVNESPGASGSNESVFMKNRVMNIGLCSLEVMLLFHYFVGYFLEKPKVQKNEHKSQMSITQHSMKIF